MIRHISHFVDTQNMIRNQVIYDLFSSLDGKDLNEEARQSAIRRLSAEAGFEVKSSKQMFEKIMGRAREDLFGDETPRRPRQEEGSLPYVDHPLDDSTSRGRIRGEKLK